MSSTTFSTVAASVFGIVALAHVARLVLHVPLLVGSTSIPMWVSWVGLLVAGGLSLWGFRTR